MNLHNWYVIGPWIFQSPNEASEVDDMIVYNKNYISSCHKFKCVLLYLLIYIISAKLLLKLFDAW